MFEKFSNLILWFSNGLHSRDPYEAAQKRAMLLSIGVALVTGLVWTLAFWLRPSEDDATGMMALFTNQVAWLMARTVAWVAVAVTFALIGVLAYCWLVCVFPEKIVNADD